MSAIGLALAGLVLAGLGSSSRTSSSSSSGSSSSSSSGGSGGDGWPGVPNVSTTEQATEAAMSRTFDPELPPWIRIALEEYGQAEQAGSGDNARIVEYHQAVDGAATPDAVPWCSSFANWVIGRAGMKGTSSRMARSWLSWRASTEPRFGAVVVLRRGSDPSAGHVGFLVASNLARGLIYVLGGNQSDKVTISPFNVSDVLGYRWPGGVA